LKSGQLSDYSQLRSSFEPEASCTEINGFFASTALLGQPSQYVTEMLFPPTDISDLQFYVLLF